MVYYVHECTCMFTVAFTLKMNDKIVSDLPIKRTLLERESKPSVFSAKDQLLPLASPTRDNFGYEQFEKFKSNNKTLYLVLLLFYHDFKKDN